MRFIPGCLLLLLLISSLSPGHGVLETLNTSFKCKCMKSVPNLRKKYWGQIVKVESHKPKEHCPRQEVIVRLNTGLALCLNPESKWTKRLLTNAMKSNNLTRDSGST